MKPFTDAYVPIESDTDVATTETTSIVPRNPPAVTNMDKLVTTFDFVRNTMPTSTPEDSMMTPPAEATHATPSGINTSKVTPPRVVFFHRRYWYIDDPLINFNTNGRVYTREREIKVLQANSLDQDMILHKGY